MTTGVDYAWGRPTPAGIKAAGHTFVCRYLSKDPKKNLTPAEAKALLVGGLDIVVVWETTAQRAGQGQPAGAIDGAEAKRQAEACGAPPSSPIYFAVDYDAQPSAFGRIGEYARAFGAETAPHPVGVYGSYAVCDAMLGAGAATYAWQTVAWSRGKRLAAAHLYQRLGQQSIDGVACDVNEALKADFGGWKSSLSPDYPTPPQPATEDDVVYLAQYNDAAKGIFTTDLVTKQWLETNEDITYARYLGAKDRDGKGAPVCDPGNAHWDTFFDAIPLVGLAPPGYKGQLVERHG